MKVFISHKHEDSWDAIGLAWVLSEYGHTYYLDTVDDNLNKDGDDLGDYIRGQMDTCDALVVVISEHTQNSWWVPWEIGVATEKNYPLSTCLTDGTTPPSYLEKWPILRRVFDVRAFAILIHDLEERISDQRELKKSLNEARRLTVPDFHRELKRAINRTK